MKGSNYPAPLETPSKIFTAFMLLTGALLQASVIAAAASLLANLDRHKLALRQRLDEIGAHLAHHKVDGPLRDRVRAFFEYLFHCGHHTNEDELLEGLSEKLRMQVRSLPLLPSHTARNCACRCARSLTPALTHAQALLRRSLLTSSAHRMLCSLPHALPVLPVLPACLPSAAAPRSHAYARREDAPLPPPLFAMHSGSRRPARAARRPPA
jgi:hypothetical protein